MTKTKLEQRESDASISSGPNGSVLVPPNLPLTEVLSRLRTNSDTGLDSSEVERRRLEYGANDIPGSARPTLSRIIIGQFQSSVVYLLGVATIISIFMHELIQAAGIGIVLVINAALGTIIEYRAQTSLAHLMKLAGAVVRVRRNSNEFYVPVADLVPGDIVKLAAGERVPADLRIIECASLSADESSMSGESTPQYKDAKTEEQSEKASLLFQGTLILSGRALAVVTQTGANSALGQMGKLLSEVSSGTTPLEQQLGELGDVLTKLTIIVCVVVGLVGVLHHLPILFMFETSITLAVAAIPEALPLIATLAMAVGIRRMIKSQALIRRLPAVETLGCTTIICTDKTGTLTENKMVVTNIVVDGHALTLTGNGYEPEGELKEDGETIGLHALKDVDELLTAAALCNDAKLENHVEEGGWHIHGDPTEGALLVAAQKLDISSKSLKSQYPRLAEIPFDLNRKRMSTVHQVDGAEKLLYAKGAPETILSLCTKVLSHGRECDLTESYSTIFTSHNHKLAGEGLRVLAIARRRLPNAVVEDIEHTEKELTFLGLVALADRPKPGVSEAIAQCGQSGVKVIMLTGDQLHTAAAVGTELGISSGAEDEVIDAQALTEMNDVDVCDILQRARVLSRTSPETKLRVVRMLQHAGHVVAMTGDGVNDAPALKQADIGIAMGACGTQMACESASMVITNDDFSTIITAIAHGRITYDNIRRCVGYLLTASLTSVMIVSLGIFTNTGLLLKPLQLLCLNLIMHVFPALGIVVQTYDRGLMSRPPRSRTSQILGKPQLLQIILRSTIISGIVLACVLTGMFSVQHTGTAVLISVSLSLVAQSWLWLARPMKYKALLNLPMIGCTLLAVAILLLSVHWAPLAAVLGTMPMTPAEWHSIAAIVLTVTILTCLGGKTRDEGK